MAMRRLKYLLLCILLGSSLLLSAQEYRLGGGLDYNVDVKRTGLFLRGSVAPDSLWRLAGAYNYFFDGGARTSKWEFALDGHLFFWSRQRLDAYLIGGLNFFHFRDARSSTESGAAPPPRGNHFGINLGAGIETQLNERLFPFAEMKVSVGDGSLFGIFVGFNYRLKSSGFGTK